jgi:hypothetical protein
MHQQIATVSFVIGQAGTFPTEYQGDFTARAVSGDLNGTFPWIQLRGG